MANDYTLLKPRRKLRRNGTHWRADVSKRQLEKAAIYTPAQRRRFVDAVAATKTVRQRAYIADASLPVTGPDPTGAPQRTAQCAKRPPPGGLGCKARAGNLSMASPARDRTHTRCRRCDVSPIYWPREARKKDYASTVRGHLNDQPRRCRNAKPYKRFAERDPNALTTPDWTKDVGPRQP